MTKVRANRSKEEIKQAAHQLYQSGAFNQAQIAEMLKVSEKSISAWKNEGNWEYQRQQDLLNQETSNKNLWDIANYTSSVFAEKAKELFKEGKTLSPAELDGLHKIHRLVKKEVLAFDSHLAIVRQLTTYIKEQDLELAKQLIPHFQSYIALKQKELQ